MWSQEYTRQVQEDLTRAAQDPTHSLTTNVITVQACRRESDASSALATGYSPNRVLAMGQRMVSRDILRDSRFPVAYLKAVLGMELTDDERSAIESAWRNHDLNMH